jgi:hypothetical protein
MNQLNHMEFLCVQRHFYPKEMSAAPGWRDSIAYYPLGTILITDQRQHRREEGSGWQSVWESVPPYRLVWVHPAILGRFDIGVQVLALEVTPQTVNELNARYPRTLHVDVRSMGGWTHCSISDHTGLCRLVIEAKLWGTRDKAAAGGQLIANVVRGLQRLTREHSDICFCCEHGKHRSVAAYSVVLATVPLSHASCHELGRRYIRRCRAKCSSANWEEICALIEEYLLYYIWS